MPKKKIGSTVKRVAKLAGRATVAKKRKQKKRVATLKAAKNKGFTPDNIMTNALVAAGALSKKRKETVRRKRK